MRGVSALVASAVLVLGGLGSTGCASVNRTAEFREFTGGRYDSARALYERRIAEGGTEVTLDQCSAGTAALSAGDVDGAHRHFLAAYRDLEDLSATTGETVTAMVGPESSKRWKGDPYERCMNAYYLGVTYWLKGDADNAAASFKAGLLRDADSEAGAAQSDFALLWYLMGEAQRQALHNDRGQAALRTASELRPGNPHLAAAEKTDANFVLALDMGLGPRKVASGPHGSHVRFEPRIYAGSYAEVSANGTALGRTSPASDTYHQAVTRGDKTLDHVNEGKAVFKDAAVIGGAIVLDQSRSRGTDAFGVALILLGLATRADADTRQWDTLPGEVQVFRAQLEPGEYEVFIDVRDRSHHALPSRSQRLTVQIRDGHTTFAWARSGLPARRLTQASARGESAAPRRAGAAAAAPNSEGGTR